MPSNFTEERQVIESKFDTEFNNYTPVQYDNISSLLDGNVMVEQDDVSEWVRLSIRNFDNTPTALGNQCRQDRIFGQISVTVFVRENLGSNRAREIVDHAFPVFHRLGFDGITTRNTVVSQTPPLDGWFQIDMSTEYFWDFCLD